METNDITRRMQAEIDALNVALIAKDAEIARLNAIEQRHATLAGEMMASVAKEVAAAGAEADIRSAALAVTNCMKREMGDGCCGCSGGYCKVDYDTPPAKVQGAASESWLPTADNVNGLPRGVRDFVHDLATRCDPAGDVAAITLLRDQCEGLQVMYRKAADALAEVRGCFEAAEVEGLAAALDETTDDNLQDLVRRRLMHAYFAAADVPSIPAPIETVKKPMTYDEFFAEADCTGLTIDALIPGVVARLGEMEAQGIIRKHEDGGHEFVAPTEAAEAGSIDTEEFRKRSFAYAKAIMHGSVPESSAAWGALITYIDSFFADRIDADAREVLTDWISVEDRMPLENELVAILFWPYDNHENAQIVASATHIGGSFFDHEGDEGHPPSHWTPLPAIESALTAQPGEKA